MKIGLFGGSFNPPHIGHLRAAKIFCEKACLDELYVMPAFVSPFKVNDNTNADSKHRLNMAKLCFSELESENTKITVSDFEITKATTSYTIDTVNHLVSTYGVSKLYMLIGSDMFCSLEKWKSFEDLFKKCIIYTLVRDDSEKQLLNRYAELYAKKYGAQTVVCDCPALTVSSTDIRRELSAKNSLNFQNLLTKSVLRYIIENKLFVYNDGVAQNVFCHEPVDDKTIEIIKADMDKFLTPKRLNHTIGVCNTALEIAKDVFVELNIDEKYFNDIKAAALLHDFTKGHELISQKELCVKYGITTDSVSCNSCNLLHSKTAAYLARQRYNINDIVFSAVFNHTTGCENMNVFDKIIFLADYIEPGRKQDVCVELRNKLYAKHKFTMEMLDLAVLESLDSTIKYLLSTASQIDLQTIKARNYLTAINAN